MQEEGRNLDQVELYVLSLHVLVLSGGGREWIQEVLQAQADLCK